MRKLAPHVDEDTLFVRDALQNKRKLRIQQRLALLREDFFIATRCDAKRLRERVIDIRVGKKLPGAFFKFLGKKLAHRVYDDILSVSSRQILRNRRRLLWLLDDLHSGFLGDLWREQ